MPNVEDWAPAAGEPNPVARGRGQWSGRAGLILATIGSAVGLGSIWKFPYEVGENGGGAFVLIYLAGLLLVVLPLMLAEFAIGRRGGGDAMASISRLAKAAGEAPAWRWLGALMLAAGFGLLSYYSVIGGLTIAYGVQALGPGFQGLDAAGAVQLFAVHSGDPLALAVWHGLFMALTVAIVARGIEQGIETACRLLMPLLAAIMLLLALHGAASGELMRTAGFLLAPRFEALTPRVALEALGLGFFSIGVGFGVLLTYAAHAPPGAPLGTVALATLAGDTAISLLAGFAVFPLVFAHGLDPAAGTSLIFLTLPIAFGQIGWGGLMGGAFFTALALAALASAIALLELVVGLAIRWTGWPRPRAALAVGLACWIAGLPSVLSFNLWRDVLPLAFLPGFAEAGILEALDSLISNLALPLAGFLLAIFAARLLATPALAAELGWPARRLAALRALLGCGVPALILAVAALGHLPG